MTEARAAGGPWIIVHAGESVCGGVIRLHRVGSGWRWHWGVSGPAVFASRADAVAVAVAVAATQQCLSWDGRVMGPARVLEGYFGGEFVDPGDPCLVAARAAYALEVRP